MLEDRYGVNRLPLSKIVDTLIPECPHDNTEGEQETGLRGLILHF